MYDVALFVFYTPADLQGGLATDGAAPVSAIAGNSLPLMWVSHSVGISLALGTGTGVGQEEQC